MNDKTETITLDVTEVVQTRFTIEVTPELLDAAEGDGLPRTAEGVGRYLYRNPDRDEVIDGPESFVGVVERDVTDWEVN